MNAKYTVLSEDATMNDIWNAIYLPLPEKATKEFITSIYNDAEYCYVSARSRYHDPNSPSRGAFEPMGSPHNSRGTIEDHVNAACRRIRDIEARWPGMPVPLSGKPYEVQLIDEMKKAPGFAEPEARIGDDCLSVMDKLRLSGGREMTMDELHSDAWNSIYLSLPDSPTGELIEFVHAEAHNCYQAVRGRFDEPRSSDVQPYEPILSQYSAAATVDGHLDAAYRRVREIEDRWPNYLDKMEGQREVQSLEDCRKEREIKNHSAKSSDAPDKDLSKELSDQSQLSLNQDRVKSDRQIENKRGHPARDFIRRTDTERGGRGR